MHIVITGGAGFLGSQLARRILDEGRLVIGGQAARRVERLTLVDLAPPAHDLLDDPRVRSVRGGVEALSRDVLDDVAGVFHLAAAVSGACEADFDLGMQANLVGSIALLEQLRRTAGRPVLVFASSLAVYGTWDGMVPDPVTDKTLPTPTSSYGTQKLMIEQLVADHARRGFVDGRTLRLMTVAVRPGRPNAAASSFLSSIVREPIAGRVATCPVPSDTEVALCSPRKAVEGLLIAAELASAEWGPPTPVNLPSLRTSVADLVAALGRVAGEEAIGRILWAPDPAAATIVMSWPSRFITTRALKIGMTPDTDAEALVRQYVDDHVAVS